MTCTCWASPSFTSGNSVVSWIHETSGTIVATGHSLAQLTLDFGQTVGCEDGWTYHEGGDTCIRLVLDKRSRLSARRYCQDFGGDLIRIPDTETQAFIEDLLSTEGVSDSVYIGLQDRWEFSIPGDNTVVYSSLWAAGEPNNLGGNEDCVAMKYSGPSASLMDCPCSDLNGFLCEKPYKGDCGVDHIWSYYGGNCYFVEADSKGTWEHVNQYCDDIGAQLAVVDSATLHTHIFNLVNTGAYVHGFPFYIGMHNVREFYWLDDDPSISLPFTLWKKGSPSMTNTTARCVVLGALEGKWQEQACDVQSSFLCQKDPVSFGPLPRTYECKVKSGVMQYSLHHTFRLAPTTTKETTTPPPTTTTTRTLTLTTTTQTTTTTEQQPPDVTTTTPPQTSALPTPSQPPSYWSCTCSKNLISNLTEVEVTYLTSDLQRDLAVDVDSLSATIRKKNCAKDPRLTPRIAATVAMTILATSFISILVSDCFKFFKFYKLVAKVKG